MKELYAKVFFALIICISGILIFFTLSNGHSWGDDFSAYIMQAQSIVEGTPGKFIEANRLTVENSSFHLKSTACMRGFPVAYPWGFPLLLVPVFVIFGLNIMALKIVCAVSFLVFLVLIWFGFGKYHSNVWLLVLVFFFALNPVLLYFLNNIISDIPFLLFSTFAVLLMGTLVIEKRIIVSPVFDNILLGTSIAGAFFIRSNGILLLATLAITQFISLVQKISQSETVNNHWLFSFKKILSPARNAVKNICIALLPYASFLVISLLWRTFLPEGGTSHLELLNMITAESIKIHIACYVQLLAKFFIGVPFHYLIYCTSIPFVIAGLIKRFRSDYHIVVYVILTFLIYIIFPVNSGLRYLFPVIPFYLSFSITGLGQVQGGKTEIEKGFRRLICILPVIFTLSYFCINSTRAAYENTINNRRISNGPFTVTAKNMFSFIKDSTESDSRIIFFKPRVMRMMTGRKSLIANNAVEILRGDYLCIDMNIVMCSQMPVDDVVALSKQGFARLIYKNSEFEVYRLMDKH